ncbi:helix-turn-helix domain-containing protein, partial [Klebsiella pneumoniae]|nr:helix-turn-helix domain-containing protein [Klebsiella pneumoniae]
KSVKAYINGEGSLSTISHKVGISERQFREWIRKYKTNGVEGLIR